MTLADLRAFYDEHFLDTGRSAIVTYSVGNAANVDTGTSAIELGTKKIADPADFRANKSYFPH